MTSLYVPCFIWHAAPSHSVTAALLSTDGTRFITGTEKGMMCIWDCILKKDQASLQPAVVLLGNDVAVTALENCTYDLKEAVISTSADGTVAVWSLSDGQCLATKSRALKCNPTKIKILPDEQYAVASGDSLSLEILEINTLKVVRRIQGHEDWIVCLDWYMRDNSPSIMSMCSDSTLRVWLYGEAAKKSELYDLPIQAAMLDLGPGKPTHSQISPNGSILLVVTSGTCKFFSMGGFRHLWSVSAPANASVIYGSFVDDFHVFIWSNTGKGYLYRLPTAVLKNAELDRSKSRPSLAFATDSSGSSGSSSDSILKQKKSSTVGGFEIIKIPAHWKSDTQLLAEFTVSDPHRPLHDLVIGVKRHTVYLCHDNGEVAVWSIPTVFESDKIPYIFTPDKEAKFSDAWQTEQSASSDSAVTLPSRFVTSSLVIEKELQMICGYSDGTISMSKLPTDSAPVTWQAHRAKVNCLLMMRKEHNYLISGSNDFYIKVWDVSNEHKLVHTFSNHSGPVRSLFMADSDAPRTWKYRFFSIGEDRSVALFHLDSSPHCVNIYGSHPAPISFCKWRPDQDYLFVASKDGSLSIWEMSSAQLESTIYGPSVKEILDIAKNLSKEDKLSLPKLIARQAVTGTTLQMKADSPIQAVILNVKLLTAELGAAVKQLLPSSALKMSDSTPSTPVALRKTDPAGSLRQSSAWNVSAPPSPASPVSPTSPSLSASSILYNSFNASVQSGPAASIAMKAALHLPAFRVCTYLLPWGLDQQLDQEMITSMYMKPPKPQVCYGCIGAGGRLSILAPRAAPIGRWISSDMMTSVHSLASTAIAKSLMLYDEQRLASVQLLSFCVSLLPEKDSQDEVMQATRSLFSSVLNRLSSDAKRALAMQWSATLKSVAGPNTTAAVSMTPIQPPLSSSNSSISLPTTPLSTPQKGSSSLRIIPPASPMSASLASQHAQLNSPSSSGPPPSPTNAPSSSSANAALAAAQNEAGTRSKLRSQAAIVLAILGTEHFESVSHSAELPREICVELLHLIFEESPMNRLRVTATELLGKGFPVWSNFIVDTGSLIQKLLKLTLVLEPKGLGKAAKRALMLIAAREPRRFIQSVGHRFAEALTKGASIGTEMMGPKEHAQALILLGRLVKKHPMEFLIELPLLIESVVRSLDPHVPLLREVSLKPATSLVHDLVMRYPMVSFDQEEQRLAVGTKEGVIFIYDLNSATRWHVLEGHKSGIASLAFSETGILGSDPHCYKNITVAKPEKPVAPVMLLESVRLQWPKKNTLLLLRAWEKGDQASLSWNL